MASGARDSHCCGAAAAAWQGHLAGGARSLLVFLWQVHDDPTALLMTRFYQNLLGRRADLKAPLGRAEALREAKGCGGCPVPRRTC